MPMPQTTLPRILTARSFRVQDAPGRNRVDDARHADHAELLVHLHLGKDRRMRVVRARRIIHGSGGFLPLDTVRGDMLHGVSDRHRARRIPLADKPAIRKRSLVRRDVRERRIRHLLCQTQQFIAHRSRCRRDAIRHRGSNP